jgi:hypothetical protein
VTTDSGIPPDLQRWLEFFSESSKPLFVCRDKKPLKGSRGFKDATADIATLLQLARDNPGCQWGMPTGKETNTTVTDVDLPRGGGATIEALEKLHGPIDPKVRQYTCHGWHDLWQYIPGTGSRADALGKGVDIRSDGGYIIVPPSPHPNGRYTPDVDKDLRDHAPGPAEAWMRNMLLTGYADPGRPLDAVHRLTSSREWGRLLSSPSETRHATLARIAGHCFATFLDGFSVLAIALLWNAQYARPEPLPEAEVRRIVNGIARREWQKRQGKESE